MTLYGQGGLLKIVLGCGMLVGTAGYKGSKERWPGAMRRMCVTL